MNQPPLLPNEDSTTETIRTGQKLLIYAILLNVGSIVFRLAIGGQGPLIASGLIGLIAICLSIIGILRLSSGLGYHMVLRILFSLLMFIPLVSLLVLFVLNSKATAYLKARGYHVGLLGAGKRTSSGVGV